MRNDTLLLDWVSAHDSQLIAVPHLADAETRLIPQW
jgi:hypothetical protein